MKRKETKVLCESGWKLYQIRVCPLKEDPSSKSFPRHILFSCILFLVISVPLFLLLWTALIIICNFVASFDALLSYFVSLLHQLWDSSKVSSFPVKYSFVDERQNFVSVVVTANVPNVVRNVVRQPHYVLWSRVSKKFRRRYCRFPDWLYSDRMWWQNTLTKEENECTRRMETVFGLTEERQRETLMEKRGLSRRWDRFKIESSNPRVDWVKKIWLLLFYSWGYCFPFILEETAWESRRRNIQGYSISCFTYSRSSCVYSNLLFSDQTSLLRSPFLFLRILGDLDPQDFLSPVVREAKSLLWNSLFRRLMFLLHFVKYPSLSVSQCLSMKSVFFCKSATVLISRHFLKYTKCSSSESRL